MSWENAILACKILQQTNPLSNSFQYFMGKTVVSEVHVFIH